MLIGKVRWLLGTICLLCVIVQAQEAHLEPGKVVEREIAGAVSHSYLINLSAGQFIRVVLEQKGIDLSLVLATPDSKQVAAINLTRPGGFESLSAEAASGGDYRLVVRAVAPAHIAGAYLLRAEARAPTPEDMQRITAEGMLVEANPMVGQSNAAVRAVELLDKALLLWRALGDRYWEANTLNLLARSYSSLKLDEKAIEYAEQGLTLHRELKNHAGQASALNTIGSSSTQLGKFEKAIEYREQALIAVREVRDRAAEGIVLNNLAINQNSLGRLEKAIEYAGQALPILREMNLRFVEAQTLDSLGLAYLFLGRMEEAMAHLEQSLAIAREVKDRKQEGIVLRHLNSIHVRQNRTVKAREYVEQALAIARELKDRAEEGRSLAELGNYYASLGRHEKSIEYSKQALDIAREVKDRSDQLIALANIGNQLLAFSRKEEAIPYLEQARVIARELNLRSLEGEILVFMGAAYIDLNNEKAIEYLEQSLAITREMKERVWELEGLIKLARVHDRLLHYGKAKEYGLQALAIAREVGLRDCQVDVLSILAEGERDLGNLERARSLIEEAARIEESVRSQVFVQEARSSLLAYRWYVYDLQIDVLMRLHKANPRGGFEALAIEASERMRAHSLLETLREAGADIRQDVDAGLLERERTLSNRLNAIASARTHMLDGPRASERAAALATEISQIEHDYEGVRADIRRASPHYSALTQPQALKLREIQQLLDSDTLLLEYALGEERSYLWAITKDSVTSHELPNEKQIQKSALAVRELLTVRSSNGLKSRERIAQAELTLPSAAAALSQIVLAPVAAELGSKRLVIVADGALQYIPFAMLPEPRGQGAGADNQKLLPILNPQPLIVNHEIVIVPSASVLATQRAELRGRPPAPKLLAVIADPVFDRTDERLKTGASKSNDRELGETIGADDERRLEHLAEQTEKSTKTRRLVVPRLPFTRQEATRLLALAPKRSSLGAIDFRASRAMVVSGEIGQYRYVHFATHGLLDSERPGLSSLVLSMVDEQGKAQDGFLRTNDIYNLKLPAELVVLSACQTGLGKEMKGEGLVGLTRGFMYAGAARVIVSLWNVNDKATAELMTNFYEKMLKQGARPAAALRAAQVEMSKQKQWQSPYYWAAFTMQGDWR